MPQHSVATFHQVVRCLGIGVVLCLLVTGCNANQTPQLTVLDLKAEAARDKIAAGRRAAQGEFLQEQQGRQHVVERILAAAECYMGARYRFGGTSPNGFDCSGFVQTVFRQLHYELPHSSRDQALLGEPVGRNELEPGDLVFFDIRRRGVISHVGIYIGNGEILHASVHTGVTIDNLSDDYYRTRYATARRILDPADRLPEISSAVSESFAMTMLR